MTTLAYPAIPRWLNPRRSSQLEALLTYLSWRGRRVWVDSRFYADLRNSHQLTRYQVDQATDDAHTLRLISMRSSGGTFVIELLADETTPPLVGGAA